MIGVFVQTTSTLVSFMTDIAGGVAPILSTVGDVCSTIVETPFLLFTVCFLFVGGCVGIVGRLLSRG